MLPPQPVLGYPQHPASSSWQGSSNNCPCSSPTEPPCPHLLRSHCVLPPQLRNLELLPTATGQAQEVALWEASAGSTTHAKACSPPSTHPAHLPAIRGTLCRDAGPPQLLRALQWGKRLSNTQPHSLFQKLVDHSTFATSALAAWLVVQIEILVRDAPAVVEVVLRRARKNGDRELL